MNSIILAIWNIPLVRKWVALRLLQNIITYISTVNTSLRSLIFSNDSENWWTVSQYIKHQYTWYYNIVCKAFQKYSNNILFCGNTKQFYIEDYDMKYSPLAALLYKYAKRGFYHNDKKILLQKSDFTR